MHLDPFEVRPIERSCVCAAEDETHTSACEAAYKAKLLDAKSALRAAFDRRRYAADN